MFQNLRIDDFVVPYNLTYFTPTPQGPLERRTRINHPEPTFDRRNTRTSPVRNISTAFSDLATDVSSWVSPVPPKIVGQNCVRSLPHMFPLNRLIHQFRIRNTFDWLT